MTKMATSENTAEAIAIVGSGCRFPGGASSPSKLWDMLLEKRDVLKDVPLTRFNPNGFYHSNGERYGSINVRKAYLLDEDVRTFDAQFFGINAREAEAIDPQHRILLETVYEAMESGGFSIEGMQASDTSVYVGVMTADYYEMLLRSPEAMPTYFATGTAASILSNRISYFFDWKGPSETINTACSSSLVAVHRAVQSLRSGESRMAVAGGANLILNPEFMSCESNLHMLSPDGRSRMWDAGANGYARGEGFAAVVLKKLSDAIADGDDIQCIIRETGVNSDGRTQGITLPSGEAQSRLIKQVYQRAGLDPMSSTDRPQYFEAHGTGTPAGDPIEARGIRNAFFEGPEGEATPGDKEDILYVGSVKTAVGHTEGTAGLAGLIKAMTAVRLGVIPGNMLFESLNPKILPLTDHLRLAAETQPWPVVAANTPRRASVNCFGFGGTNAHAILEQYKPLLPSARREVPRPISAPLAIPLVLSANSEVSLATMLGRLLTFIKDDDKLCLNDLAWTLQSRRSELAVKATFSGPSREALVANMETALAKTKKTSPESIGTRRDNRSGKMPRILGIFTGQGAQWANMGREILLFSSMAKESMAKMDAALASLSDAPAWTLSDVLTEKGRSIDDAQYSQPICTAVQVMLVDILHSMGIEFAAVVGHSSGEIGAAYSAGVLSKTEAIVIAYYRGLHTKLAQGPTGNEGGMMAAGLSFDEAEEFCAEPELSGRIWVAASNAPASVTISGDIDAIHQAKAALDAKGIFARLLKVNKAYHSAHMEPVSHPYMNSLRAIDIQPKYPRPGCTWVSSVYGDRIEEAVDVDALGCTYWKDNMLRPVLFSTAVEQTVQNEETFDFAMEVGPHTALKGPFLQTVKAAIGTAMPYGGTLMRGTNDIAALSNTLGFLMNYMAPSAINTDAYVQSFQGGISPSLSKKVPTYPWDHSTSYWAESRYSRKYRQREKPRHDLLGARLPDDLEYDMRWQNTLRVSETAWLAGHKVQGQIVYPAAAYLVMALEASKELVKDAPTKMVELLDVELSRAIALDEGSVGVDTLFGLRKTVEGSSNGEVYVEAEFACSSAVGHDAENWDLNVKGRLRVILGNDTDDSLLPRRDEKAVLLNSISVDSFYSCLSAIGFQYTGLFRRLDTIQRRMNRATASAIEYPEDKEMPVMIHPALLDSAFQGVFAALHFPEDGGMTAPYLPTTIKALRISTQGKVRLDEESALTIDTYITENTSTNIVADIDLFLTATGQPRLQIEGLGCTSLERATQDNDVELYTQTVWKTDISSFTPEINITTDDSSTEFGLTDLCERLAFMYLRKLNDSVSRDQVKSLTWTHQRIFEFIDHLFPMIEAGQHPTIRKEWTGDDSAWLKSAASKYPGQVDIQLITTIGENLLPFVRGETNLLECMMKDDMLNRYYAAGQGVEESSASMSRAVSQIAHRYAGMKILEVGAGTAATTKSILEELGHVFKSYTVTDISDNSFEKAQKDLARWVANMRFQMLDIAGDVLAQGFEEHSYDLVVVSHLVGTQNARRAMENIRRLLKPGGYVLLREISATDVLRAKFISLGLPAWWAGDENRGRAGPTNSLAQWTSLLKECQFSGVDQVTNDSADRPMYTTSVILSQAVNDEVMFLRDPLSTPALPFFLNGVCIIGKNERRLAEITKYISDSCDKLGNGGPTFTYIDRIEDVAKLTAPTPSVIFLQDLDVPIWQDLSKDSIDGLQTLVESARQILWVTSGCRLQNAYANMSVGLGRGLQSEYTHIKIQMLDVEPEDLESSNALIAGAAMRLFADDAIRASSPNLLWTQEPEIIVENGKLLIPRIMTDQFLNDRLNARRRAIQKQVVPSQSAVFITQSSGSYVLSEPYPTIIAPPRSSDITVQVTHSMLHTIKAADAYLYLNLGRVIEAGEHPAGTQVLAFSHVNASIITVNPGMVVPIYVEIDAPLKFIQTVATIFVATELFSKLHHGSKILMFAPEQTLSQFFEGTARALRMDPFLACSTPGTGPSRVTGLDAVYINPSTTERNLRTILPSKIEMFLDFSSADQPASIAALGSYLSEECIHVKVHELFGKPPSRKLINIPTSLHEGLLKSQFVALGLIKCPDTPAVTSLLELTSNSQIRAHPCVLDFTRDKEVPVRVSHIRPETLFRSDRTYLLVGCTGGLGQALCRWMVSNGAKHLALTTRNPKSVNQTWLDELTRAGGSIKIFACDVTDGTSLHKTHDEISKTMPPIAGVANAAMVLADRLFSDTTLDDFQKVLKPKVDGTIQLDKLFSDCDLDFFILFSSLANTVGNRGQSNYLAANGFMTTVAAQRRKRGLTASVMHIGMVLGIGVVSQEGLYETSLKRQKWMPISEPFFLDMFAECILVGKPNSGHSQEFITGLPRNSTRPGADNPWYASNLRFSHHILVEENDDSGDGAILSLKQRLAIATTLEARSEIIQESFLVKLGRVLATSADSIEKVVPLLALGVDSLMAMEIRSWFMAEVEVDMPVLKVLGGGSVASLCTDAAASLPTSILSAAVIETVGVPHSQSSLILMKTQTQIAPLAPASDMKTTSERQLKSTTTSSRSAPSVSSKDSSVATPPSTVGSQDDFVWVAKNDTQLVSDKSVTDQYKRVSQMSFSQERLWFLQSYLTNPSTYNITLAYRIKGKLRIADFEQAFFDTIERHETLRTAFFTDSANYAALQGAVRNTPFKMEQKPFTGEAQIKEEFKKTNEHSYDLEHAESMKATLLVENPTSHVLIMGFHHIAVDATSSQILVKDFSTFYAGVRLQPLAYQYMDWAAKQRAMVKQNISQDAAYWKKEFSTIPQTLPLLEFGTVKSRKPLTEYQIRIMETRLDAALTTTIKLASQKLRITPFHLHLATLQTLLYKLLNVEDVCIGITDANKNDPDHVDTLGFFVNLLPLRLRSAATQSFASLAQKARDKTLAALSHSQLPFNVLLDELEVPRSTTANPLFQVLMNYKMGSLLQVPFGECQAEVCEFQDASNPYDLQFDVEAAVDGTTLITVTTQEYLYSKADLSTVLNVYTHLLKSLSAKPALAIQDHSLYSKQDLQAALQLGTGPRLDIDETLTISGLFDNAVKNRSNAVAVVDNLGESLTWIEAASWVSTIAAHLLRIGIAPGAFVCVYCEPSVKSICYWLAILRIGAIYVPLDVSNPVARLELIVEDCDPAAIICDENTWTAAQRFRSRNRHIVKLSNMGSRQSYYIDDLSTPQTTACVIYTSGTTGKPKGTLLSNSNLVNHIIGVCKQYNTSEEVILQPTNLGFDLSLGQMMQFLASQGKLVVASIQSRTDPLELVKLMAKHKVTYTIVTPSVYSLLFRQGGEYLKQCTSWRLAFSCGEALTSNLVKDFQQLNLPKLKLINSCGPTEITIINSAWEIPLQDPNANEYAMNIGSSLPNYSTFILGADLNPVPVGFAGEMVCGGGSISQGYLHMEELTATKWVRNTFASPRDQSKGWTRMYRTGDRAKMLPDGSFVFLGRIAGDQQVKLRGVRIELGDVASTIVRHANGEISEASVTLRGEGDSAFLAAFVAFANGVSPQNPNDYAKNLLTGLPLPASMVPSRVIALTHLPRTPNGKIDQRELTTMELPNIVNTEMTEDIEIDSTETEMKLKDIWSVCLPHAMAASSMRKTTDFFFAGGNSMLLVNVQAKIRNVFSVTVPLYTLFQSSTIESMAAQVDAVANVSTTATKKVNNTANKKAHNNAAKVNNTPAKTSQTCGEVENTVARINWTSETELDQALLEQSKSANRVKPVSRTALEVVLTGATGFLGTSILHELVSDPRVAKIHCIAIRLREGETSRPFLVKSPKIVQYYGDLSTPRLGLSEAEFSQLATKADRIIHNAADVSFLKSYKSLSVSNLGSTKQLAQMAVARKIPIHFVSTSGVASFFPTDDLPETFIPSHQPPTDGSMGYAASKWAAETYLHNAYEQAKLPVRVHRPANILGEGAEAVNMTANILEYSLRIGAVPLTPNLDGAMQFVDVDEVSSGIVHSLFAGVQGAMIYHHCGDDKIDIRDLGTYLEQKFDRQLLDLELGQWLEQAQGAGLSASFASLIGEVLDNKGGNVRFKTLGRN